MPTENLGRGTGRQLLSIGLLESIQSSALGVQRALEGLGSVSAPAAFAGMVTAVLTSYISETIAEKFSVINQAQSIIAGAAPLGFAVGQGVR